MNDSANKLKEFSDLVDEHRPREAFMLFLEQVENKSWRQLLRSTTNLAILDTLCQSALPELREQHTLWMVKHPERLRRMLELLAEALAVNYRRAATVDHIAWLRCLLAIAEAMAGRVEHVHEELCLIRAGPEVDSIPEPNGTFRKQVQTQASFMLPWNVSRLRGMRYYLEKLLNMPARKQELLMWRCERRLATHARRLMPF